MFRNQCFSTAFLLSAFIIILAGCKNSISDADWKNPSFPFNDSVTFNKTASVSFKLDPSTILRNESCQYVEKLNTLVSYNSTNSDLLFFDIDTRKMVHRINLIKAGIPPLERGSFKQYSFNVLGYDSIFFFDQKKKEVFLFDSAARVMRVYQAMTSQNGYRGGRAVPGCLLPVDGENIYIPTPPGRDPLVLTAPLRNNLILSISIKTGKMQPFAKYPPLYGKALWGYYFHAFYATYSEPLKKIILSYPIIHSLHMVDSNNRDSAVYAGGSTVKAIHPVRFANEKLNLQKEDEAKNFKSQRKYGNILYDRYRKLYYRVVSTQIPEKDFDIAQDKNYNRAPFYIIILDSAFKKLGEAPFDANKYATTSMFVGKDGLYMPSAESNDDNFIFDVFNPVKK